MKHKTILQFTLFLAPLLSIAQDTTNAKHLNYSDLWWRRMNWRIQWLYAQNSQDPKQIVYDTMIAFEPKDRTCNQFDTFYFYLPKLRTYLKWYSDTIFVKEKYYCIRDQSLFPKIRNDIFRRKLDWSIWGGHYFLKEAKSRTILRLVVHPNAPCYPWMIHPLQFTMEVPGTARDVIVGTEDGYADVTAYRFRHRKAIVVCELLSEAERWEKDIPFHKVDSFEEAFDSVFCCGFVESFYNWCDTGIKKYCKNNTNHIYLARKSGVLIVFFNIKKEEAEKYFNSFNLISHTHRIRRSEHPELPAFRSPVLYKD